ncbi:MULTISPECIES: hypothetical protein [Helicobacter]|nr:MULTISPECIES: hypothetical protein [Helicobacter]MDL0079378.1 hypothetical protein [Helicobacter sp. CPD2-1]
MDCHADFQSARNDNKRAFVAVLSNEDSTFWAFSLSLRAVLLHRVANK